MNTWKKNLAVMWVVQFCGFLTVTFITSFVPLYVQHIGKFDEKTTSLWSGILMGGAAFTAFFSGPIWGNIGDRYGRKAMVERVLFSNSVIALLMAFTNNLWQFLILRLIQGTLGGFMSASTALVTSLIPKNRSGFALGVFQSASIIGAASGPFIGGIIADFFSFEISFLFVSFSTLFAALLVHKLIKINPKGASAKEGEDFWQSLKIILTNKALLAMLVVNFLLQFSMMIIAPILPLFIKSLHTNTNLLASFSGLTIAIGGLFSAVSSILVGRISDRIGYRRILLTMIFLSGILSFGYLFIHNITQLLFLRSLIGLAIGGVLPTSNALINSIIPEEKKGTAFGVTTSFFLLGNVLGPLSGGTIAALFGIKSVFMVTGLILIFITIWVAKVVKIEKKLRLN